MDEWVGARTICFFSLQRDSSALEGYLGPTVSSGVAMRWKATIATVDKRSSAVLGEGGAEGGAGTEGGAGAEGAGGIVGAGGAAGVGCMGGASLSFTRLSGLNGGLGGGFDAAGAVRIGAIGGAGAAVHVRSGAEVCIGTATAAVGIGALRAASGLEWYPNQKTVAGAGVAGGRLSIAAAASERPCGGVVPDWSKAGKSAA